MGDVRTAVILAAGLGSRIRSFTKDLPKGFIPIENIPIIKHSIHKLLDCGIEKIIIGTGYKSEAYEALIGEFPQIICKKNPNYATTGSMYTLNNLNSLIEEDFLLLESDLIYDRKGIEILIKDPHENIILASGRTGSKDEVFLQVDSGHQLVSMSKNENELSSIYGELTGISKISYTVFQEMSLYASKTFTENPMLDYEYTMVAISAESNIHVLKIEDYAWCEIDDENHLKRAVNEVYPKIVQLESNS
jgi:2-aminoethylphosphonate-pyruvate transaminase/(2-aminoethyl)phosphonate cytidylyltransferase